MLNTGEAETMPQISNLMGKQYKSEGRGPDFYDCWGLVMEVSKRHGHVLPDYQVDADDTNAVIVLTRIERNLDKWEKWPEGKELKRGLIVAFQLRVKGEITHVGYMIGKKHFIHCIDKKGVCIEPIERYQNLIEGYYEFRQN